MIFFNMLPTKRIQILLVFIVLGALLHRDFRLAGLLVSLATIGFYLVTNFRWTLRKGRKFKTVMRMDQIRVVTYIALLYIFVKAACTGQIAYFLLLILLGIDYLILDKQEPRA